MGYLKYMSDIMIPLNGEDKEHCTTSGKRGLSRTIKRSYYKTSLANFLRKDSFGASGVIRICEL